MPTWNQEADLVGIFKGVFGIYDNGNHSTGVLYTYDHPTTLELLDQADAEKFYSAAGLKRKKSTGNSTTYRLVVKKTADLYDTADPPTDVRTISYFRKQIMDGIIPSAAFEGIDEADSAVNKFLRTQYIATVETIRDIPREEGLGAQEVEIAGELLSYVKEGHRQAS